MKCLNRCLALFLCIIMILSVPNTVFAVNSTTDSEDVQIYSVPIISNEYDGSHVTFYGIDGKYYLSFEDIKELARFELEETDTTITLTQGLRELVIEKSSGHLVDCDFVDQGNIDIIQYDGKYLCEGIPMLMYLGAACALKENQVLEVMMPTITIWESIMPDYLDYYFNITELYGGDDNVKISLACDIIADVLDGVSGHGLFANGDTHLEDALYEILNVDMMKYESVQEIASVQNQKINDFLSSAVFGTMLDTGDNMYDAVYEALDYYSKFYVSAKNDILLDMMTQTDDLDYASELASQIKEQVYAQSATKANLKNAKKAQSFMDIGMLAFDTAITSYSMMQYNDDTKNLFARTINQEMIEYANYYDISWNNVSDRISNTLKSTQSIVANTAIDNVAEFAVEKVTEEGAKTALSAFTSKANIYTAAIQIGSFIASLINYESNQAFSADMNAIWLSTVQYDIAQLTSRMLVKERDEYHFSDTESLTKLKDMFTLYYRTIIAFSENITKSIEEFGGKNRNEWMQYFGGTSGKSVCNYAAIYLYRITNCTVVPIVEYSNLKDDLLTSDWLEASIDMEIKYEMRTETIEFRLSDGTLYYSNTIEYPYFSGNSAIESTLNLRYADMISDCKTNDTDFDASYQENLEWGLDASALPFYDDTLSEVVYNDRGAFSIKETYLMWSGGAHPYHYESALNYDLTTGAELTYFDILDGTDEEIDRILRHYFEKSLWTPTDYEVSTLKEYTAYALCKDGLCFYYNVGDAVPREEIVIPYTSDNTYIISASSLLH